MYTYIYIYIYTYICITRMHACMYRRIDAHKHIRAHKVKFLQYMLARAALPDTWRSATGDAAPELDSDDDGEDDTPALLNLPVSALHGDMAQGERTATFLAFLAADRSVLVCTDVAARGLDFPKVTLPTCP